MYERRFRNLPYILWRVVFKKSRSLGSSESNNSRSFPNQQHHFGLKGLVVVVVVCSSLVGSRA